MTRYQNVDEQMAALNIEDEENESLIFEGDVEENVNKYDLCLVGRFLTEKTLNVRAMKSKMADIWKPTMGINIRELEPGIFLFQFYHKEDMQWVYNGGPWSFDNVMLALSSIPNGEDPVKVPLWHFSLWIQIYDLPSGFMNENVGRQLGNFFGEFLQYDEKNDASIWREFMRLKIRIDVRKPLKRKKKITKKNKSEVVVSCKYERLGEFCFSCGLVTHTERFCRRYIDKRAEEGAKEWGNWLKAPPRRMAGTVKSKWLREEDDDSWESRVGRENSKANFQDNPNSNSELASNEGRDNRELIIISAVNKNSSSRKAVSTNFAGGTSFSNPLYGPEDEEMSGLQAEERKRKRVGPNNLGIMNMEGANNMGDLENTVMQDGDNTSPKNLMLAGTAVQARHSK